MENQFVLTIDIGTRVIKTHIFTPNGICVQSSAQNWINQNAQGIPLGLEFNPSYLLGIIQKLVLRTLSSNISQNSVRAIICTCQRLGYIFLDRENKAFYGIPNIDRRAMEEARLILPSYGEQIYRITGRWPGPSHLLTKIRWFQKNKSLNS